MLKIGNGVIYSRYKNHFAIKESHFRTIEIVLKKKIEFSKRNNGFDNQEMKNRKFICVIIIRSGLQRTTKNKRKRENREVLNQKPMMHI